MEYCLELLTCQWRITGNGAASDPPQGPPLVIVFIFNVNTIRNNAHTTNQLCFIAFSCYVGVRVICLGSIYNIVDTKIIK